MIWVSSLNRAFKERRKVVDHNKEWKRKERTNETREHGNDEQVHAKHTSTNKTNAIHTLTHIKITKRMINNRLNDYINRFIDRIYYRAQCATVFYPHKLWTMHIEFHGKK